MNYVVTFNSLCSSFLCFKKFLGFQNNEKKYSRKAVKIVRDLNSRKDFQTRDIRRTKAIKLNSDTSHI